MTWTKALPILAISLIFDAVRLLFEMFWFFGPALAALYCTIQGSGTAVGAFAGVTAVATICGGVAGVAGFFGAGAIEAFGVIMAIAVGLLGWMTVGLILIMTNARIFKENAGHSLWFIGSLLISEVPIIGALPALTGTTLKMYHAQIKKDKKALVAYEKRHADEQLQERRQQAAELMQSRDAEQAQEEIY